MTDKEIMITCPNSNLKSYILKLHHLHTLKDQEDISII